MKAFFAGFFLEITYLAWLWSTGSGWPFWSAITAGAVGAISVTGLREGLASNRGKWWLVAGYVAGSFVAALIRRRLG